MNKVFVSVILVFLSASYCCSQNLIKNGSFENPGVSLQQQVPSGSTFLTDWIIGGSGDVYLHNGPANGGVLGPAEDGAVYLDLSGSGSPHASVYQDFSTIPGGIYLLKFYIGSSSVDPEPTIKVDLLDSNGLYILNTTLTPAVPSASINWLETQCSFAAQTSLTRLQFHDTSSIDDNGSYIDNVSVIAVPEPILIFPLGLIALLLRRKGWSN